MFLKFFGLNEQPFGVTPDPRFLYMSPAHEEAFASLLYGIETGRGFVALFAAPGLGKTTLLLRLMERLQDSARTAFLFQTHLQSGEFLKSLIADLGIEPAGKNMSDLQRQFSDVLVKEWRAGKRVVVAIDEAQNLDDATLEMVRMLSNFETPQAKLLQIILVGQKELADKLARPQLEQLRQRVSIITHFPPFAPAEVAKYIHHRLRVAGFRGGPLFTPTALQRIAEQSGGVPRNINNLCFHALSLAFAKNQKLVDDAILQEVLTDLNLHRLGAEPSPQPPSPGESVGEMPPRVRKGSRAGARVVSNPKMPPRPHPASGAVSPLNLDDVYLSANSMGGDSMPPPPAPRRTALTLALLALVLLACVWAGPRLKAAYESIVLPALLPVERSASNLPSQNHSNPVTPSTGSRVATTESQAPSKENTPPATDAVAAPDSSTPDEKAVSPARPDGFTKVSPDVPETSAPRAGARDLARAGNLNHAIVDPAVDDLGAHGVQSELVVESNLSGAHISINGRSSFDWVTPHLFSLVEGVYNVKVIKAGYEPWTRQVRVGGPREKWLMAEFRSTLRGGGTFAVETEPPGMRVFVDGQAYGVSRVERELSVGWHVCEVLTPAGGRPVSFRFYLASGEILTKKIRVYSGGQLQSDISSGQRPGR